MTYEKFEKTLELANQMAKETITMLRADLTPEEKINALVIGRIQFASTRAPDMRVEHFIPSRDQH